MKCVFTTVTRLASVTDSVDLALEDSLCYLQQRTTHTCWSAFSTTYTFNIYPYLPCHKQYPVVEVGPWENQCVLVKATFPFPRWCLTASVCVKQSSDAQSTTTTAWHVGCRFVFPIVHDLLCWSTIKRRACVWMSRSTTSAEYIPFSLSLYALHWFCSLSCLEHVP